MGRIPPAKVKRELRQEVNFGCAVCGAPLLEYHHIIPYSEVEHHDPDHMIAVCPNHHRMCDDGAISRSELYEYKKDPELSDKVDYDFYFDPHSPIIPLGNSYIEIGSFGQYTLLQIHGEPIISVNYQDKRMEFDINFYNDDNDLIAIITDNEWWANTNEFWDIRYQSNRLKLWNSKYEIGLLIEYGPEDSSISMRGRFLYDGDEVLVHPSAIKFRSNKSSVESVGFLLGSDEDYQPRINTFTYSIIRGSDDMNGVFVVGEENEGFMTRM